MLLPLPLKVLQPQLRQHQNLSLLTVLFRSLLEQLPDLRLNEYLDHDLKQEGRCSIVEKVHHLPYLVVDSCEEKDENHYHGEKVVGYGRTHPAQEPRYIFEWLRVSPPPDELVLAHDHEQKQQTSEDLVKN